MLSKNEFTKELAKNLKKARVEKGISQEELADKAGVYRTYIGHIENSRYSPSSYILYKLTKALRIPFSSIFPEN